MQLEKEKHNKDKATLKKQDVGHSSLKKECFYIRSAILSGHKRAP
jgi:hypothetical protein